MPHRDATDRLPSHLALDGDGGVDNHVRHGHVEERMGVILEGRTLCHTEKP